VDAQGSDIVFTIQDRTGTFYSFDERSSGLKYFLSYYIQYLSHRAEHTSGEIILMDEPDAYLSSQGQQDLLKILESFTTAESGHAQVIYVTHSPFLIDKNKIDRVRVLEKGSGDEGTRVVRDISRNHFEPLRSAFGAFVAETTFIGNTNIMVEGMADQILLAGMALHLHRRGALRNDTIDLNRTTIVPVSSASSVPYMVYLARGRDVEQPAVVVLLDSDDAGNEARAVLRKGPPRGKQLLNDKYVLQVGDLKGVSASTEQVIVETEDLIPAGVCLTAIVRYLKEVCGAPDSLVEDLRQEDLAQMIKEKGRAFDGVEAFVDTISKSEFHIEKVGFARTVIDVIQADRVDGVEVLEENFRVLFQQLNHVIREAERERSHVSVGRRIDRMKHSFIQDHPAMARCEDVQMLLEDMEATLQDDRESDEMKILINKLRRDFAIDASPGAGIADYASFRSRLDSISYAGKIATQEEDVIESVAPVAGHATLGQVEPLLQTPLQSKTETSREMSSVDDNVQ
jgi:energy-coupling factor transporter ATP-binding protein EcfA2